LFISYNRRPAGIKLRCDFAVFRFAGAIYSTDYRQIWYVEGNQKSPTAYQISVRSVHIWGFLTQKTSKMSNFCKLIRPIGANPSIELIFMKFTNFMRLRDLRKCVKFGVIRCLTEEVIGRKLQSGNFHQNCQGPLAQKVWVRSEKVRGVQKKDGRPLCACKVRTATDEKQCFFVCMFVCVCHAGCPGRGPDVQQCIKSPFVDQFQCGFHCFSRKKRAF